MSWHRAAAVLALAIAPMLATAAHATSHHRIHHGARHAGRLSAAHFVRHRRFAGLRHHDSARARSVAGANESARLIAGASASARLVADAKHSSDVVATAERYRGTNPTGRARQWCAAFANMVLARTGYRGSGSAAAVSFAHYGSPAPGPVPGAIVVFPHHVGFVVGVEGPGRVRVVSGNHGHRVGEGVYSTRGVIAYRYPT
jgi:uncharacterized protein (TIGR02594 family)